MRGMGQRRLGAGTVLAALFLLEILINVNGVLTNLLASVLQGAWTKNRPLLIAGCVAVALIIVLLSRVIQRHQEPAADSAPEVRGGAAPPGLGPRSWEQPPPAQDDDPYRYRASYQAPPPVRHASSWGRVDPWVDPFGDDQPVAGPPRRRTRGRGAEAALGRRLADASLDALIVLAWPVVLIWPVAALGAFGDPQFLGPLRQNVTTLTQPFAVSALLAAAVLWGLNLLPGRRTGRVLRGWEMVPPASVLAATGALVVVAIASEFVHALDFTKGLPLSPTLIWTSCLTPALCLVVMETFGLRPRDDGHDSTVPIVGVAVVFAVSIFFSLG